MGYSLGSVKPPTEKWMTATGQSGTGTAPVSAQSATPGAPESTPGIYTAPKATNWLLIGGLGTVAVIGALVVFKKMKKGKR